MKIQLFSSGVILFALLMIMSCCGNPYSCAVQEAVDDGALSKEEAANLKQLFAENAEMELDSISDWSELIDDILTQNDQMNRHEIEKVIYDIKTKVIVYLDNTYSMKGYARASDPRSFTSILYAISTYYSANPEIKIEAYYVSKDDVAARVDFNDMCNNLTGHSWAKADKDKKDPYTDAYQMNDLFGAISRMVKGSDVKKEEVICFFISDMIPSTENEKIRSDRQTMINYSERIVTMMTDSIRQLSTVDNIYSAALYQFFAPFGSTNDAGIYYKYTNGHLLLHGEKRPLYVMAIGNKYAISEWDEKVASASGIRNFSYPNQHHSFISGNKCDVKLNGYSVIENERVVVIADDNDKDAYINIDPKSLPSYMPVDSIIVTIDGNRLNVESDGRVKLGKIKSVGGHILRIQVKDIIPEWIRNSSTEDDSNLIASDGAGMAQTFYLERVFRSVIQGLTNATGEIDLYDKSYTIEITKQ